ncbi:MAG: methyltransferase domain-containing protein [Spirochaetia bacterium]|nr:methyltransferase domain-containing protein [Spirochaetia bacterium]
MSQAWYERWFNEDYALLYRHRDDGEAKLQFDLICEALALKPPRRVLDLGCGEGRYSFLFAEAGFEVLGQDLSPHLIQKASGKVSGKNPVFVRRDMRTIEGEYELILSLFTSFGYFVEADNEAVLWAVSRSLAAGGIFWLDFLNAHSIFRELSPVTEKTLADGRRVLEERRIEGGRIVKKIVFPDSDVYEESVRLYTRAELEVLFQKTGLHIEGVLGSYAGDEWTPDSPRTILFARKAS